MHVTVDFINTVHLSYTEFMKQHEIKSSTRENDVITRGKKREMHEAAAGVTWHTVLQPTCFSE